MVQRGERRPFAGDDTVRTRISSQLFIIIPQHQIVHLLEKLVTLHESRPSRVRESKCDKEERNKVKESVPSLRWVKGVSFNSLSPVLFRKNVMALRVGLPIDDDDDAGGWVGLKGAISGASVGVEATGSSGAGVASTRKFSYQTTRSFGRLVETMSRSPSPSRSAAIA